MRHSLTMLYVTNILSHHQLPIAREFAALIGKDSFRFAATEPVHVDRIALGWTGAGAVEDWVLLPYESANRRQLFLDWIQNADVVVTGNRDLEMLSTRVVSGRLTFYMGERWFKPPMGKWRLLHPRFASMAAKFSCLARHSNFHCLPMGYQSHRDMAFIKAFDGRMWQWGYFTSPSLEPLIRSDDVPTILWAGRLIPLKGVDVLIRAAARLKRAGHRFEMNIIGDGPVKEGLIALCMRNGLKDRVTFHPSVPADEVRARMRASDIYVLPSNGTEGWGAVVNEAMSEGCLAVVCQEAGSARILIRDGVSGLLFREGDDKQLYQLLSHAITDIGWRQKLACEGQRTIGSLWSPSTGAERLVALSSGLLGIGEVPKYKDGPCRQIF